MVANYMIDGTVIKVPTTFKIEDYNITNMTRVANGDMVGDIIKQARKFYFSYAAITSQECKIIHEAIFGRKKLFFTLSYVEDNEVKTCVVYVGSIPKELKRTDGGMNGNWVWANLTFDLIGK